MRKIFSSRRLENAEAVATLLRDEGIEVKIENGRALNRAIRGNFSYLDSANANPPESEVWVIRADDQPRARALMREAGLLQDTTRPVGQVPLFAITPRTQAHAKKRISRLRYGLLGLALVLVVINFMRRPAQPPAAAAEPVPPRAALTMLDGAGVSEGEPFVIATPPLLAVMLARRVLDAAPENLVCLAIDGKDPPETALGALNAEGIFAHPASACPSGNTLSIDIHRYTTDGSGSGTVLLTRQDRQSTQTLHVRRSGADWAVRSPK